MRRLRGSTAGALVAGSLSVTLAATPAYADMFGGDDAVLTGILAQGVEAVSKATATLAQLKQTYQETKTIAGYAEDAAAAYQHFSHYNSQMFSQDVTQVFESTFPDIGYFRREASNSGPWAQGSGELQRLVALCLQGPVGSCRQAQAVMTYQQTRDAIASTFGASPQDASSLQAVDHEAAQALRSGQAQTGRSARSRGLSDTWMGSCKDIDGSNSDALAGCQAAGSAAQVQALQQTADIADQVAAGNRLTALQLEQVAEQRRRELLEAGERHDVLLDGLQQSTTQPATVQAEGFNLIGSRP